MAKQDTEVIGGVVCATAALERVFHPCGCVNEHHPRCSAAK